MKLCSGGRLIDQMVREGRYSEQRATNIFKDLMLVISYCHEMGVVHRDLLGRMLTRDESARITADEVLRHPWILFYTDRTLKTMCIKSKHKGLTAGTSPPCLQLRNPIKNTDVNRANREKKTTHDDSPPTDSFSNTEEEEEEEEDESGVVDVLVVAISNVRISEPKRSRLCSPTNTPIEQQHSSNLTTTNTLCRAF
ncbi:serine/threonine-protein kinase PEPKR2-like [Raphanus sativus]|uniref:Serine/threonine-protein kinase PEPKR2-like n=1 Tax=Raphanus sativus TaxID=3726 RepID=A0A6J0KNR5_RAPSA|nr:serine/threonine-protein kinase PEPKR2-like [Raphanus sativus]